MEKKYKDTTFLRHFAVEGYKRVSRWSSDRVKVKCVVALTSEYGVGNVQTRVTIQPSVDYNGNYLGSISLENIVSCSEATEEEVRMFNDTLAKFNLCMRDIEHEREVHPLGDTPYVSVEKFTKLAIKDPSAVRYLYNGRLMTRDEAEEIELAEGDSYLNHYDNGYSYESITPMTKEQFYKAADELLSGGFKGEHNGVWLTRMDDGEYAVYVRIGKKESWSQQSNT